MITSVYQWLRFIEENYKDDIAFQYYRDAQVHQIRYAEFVNDIKRFVCYLQKHEEMVEGKHFGILGRNSYHFLVCLYGVMAAGGVVVPLNIEESLDNINYQIEFADISSIFSDGEYEKLEADFGDKYSSMLKNMDDYKSCNEYEELAESVDVEKLSMIMFTSGTTGRSKGVMMSQRNLFAPLKHFLETIHSAEENISRDKPKIFLVVPLYHMSGIGCALTWNTNGSTLNICESPKYMYRDLKQMKSDSASVVPAILKMWSKDIKRGKMEKLGGIKNIACGAATIDAQMLQEFRENGISIYQAYGMTEMCGGGTANTSIDPEKIHSVGLPGAGSELRIEDGEICIRGDHIMMGYYKNDEETQAVMRDGWFHTGDLGYLDEDGYLYLTGRKKNLIILSSGENVSPEELEGLLQRSPLIAEVLVKAVKDKIAAKIYCKEQDQVSVEAYIEEMNKKLTFYKRITRVEFSTEPLPKTAAGKIVRSE